MSRMLSAKLVVTQDKNLKRWIEAPKSAALVGQSPRITDAVRNHGRGVAAMVAGNYAAACAFLENARDDYGIHNTDCREVLLLMSNLFDVYVKLGEMKNAEQICLKLMEVDSTPPVVWRRRLVELYKKWGRLIEYRRTAERFDLPEFWS